VAAVGDLTIGGRRLAPGTGTRTRTLGPSARFAKRVRDRRLRLTVGLTATDTPASSRSSTNACACDSTPPTAQPRNQRPPE
jgi:hypothetical protein